jgi:hypothetical protein
MLSVISVIANTPNIIMVIVIMMNVVRYPETGFQIKAPLSDIILSDIMPNVTMVIVITMNVVRYPV